MKIEPMRESEFVEIAALNEKSDAWSKEFSKGEMRKKTMIKRASKWWYNSGASENGPSERLQTAIAYLNNEAGEGIAFQHGNETESSEPEKPSMAEIPSDDEISEQTRKFALWALVTDKGV